MKTFIKIIAIIIIFGKTSTSQNSIIIKKEEKVKPYFFPQLGNNFVQQATSPFSLNTSQAVLLASGIIVTGALIIADESIDNIFKPLKEKSKFIRETSPIITEFGDLCGIAGCAAFAGYGVIANDDKVQETSLLLTQALITTGVWTRIGKISFGRERPSAAYHSQQPGGIWYGPLAQFTRGGSVAQYDAFPSGHTSVAFAIATVFAEQYSQSNIVPPIAYGLATIIGITRMIEHTHWASDVFVGGCLGYLCAQQVITNYRNSFYGENSKTQIQLGLLNNSPAIQVLILF